MSDKPKVDNSEKQKQNYPVPLSHFDSSLFPADKCKTKKLSSGQIAGEKLLNT